MIGYATEQKIVHTAMMKHHRVVNMCMSIYSLSFAVFSIKKKQYILPEKCDAGKFKCARRNSCVENFKRCDGIPDCQDFFDEKGCSKKSIHFYV